MTIPLSSGRSRDRAGYVVKYLRVVAIFLATMHASLAVLAMVCLFEHALPAEHGRGHTHQDSTTPSHSPLCTLACQVGSYAGLQVSPDAAGPTMVSMHLSVIPLSQPTAVFTSVIPGRSPPAILSTLQL
jgi:hypothetical protein